MNHPGISGEVTAVEYAAIQHSDEARKFYQDVLDPIFTSRVIEIRSRIFSLDDFRASTNQWPIVKSSPDLNLDYRIVFTGEHTGAGKNVTGGVWTITACDAEHPEWNKNVLNLRDDLTMNEHEIANAIVQAIERYDHESQDEDEAPSLVKIAKKHQLQRDMQIQAKRWGVALSAIVPIVSRNKNEDDHAVASRLVTLMAKSESLYDQMFPELHQSGRRDPEILGQIFMALTVVSGEDESKADRVIQDMVMMKPVLEPYLDVFASIGSQAYPAFPSHHATDRDAIRLTLLKAVAPLQVAASRFGFWQSAEQATLSFNRLIVSLVELCKTKLEGMSSETSHKSHQHLKQVLLGKTFLLAESAYIDTSRIAYRAVVAKDDKVAAEKLKQNYASTHVEAILKQTEEQLDLLIDSTSAAMKLHEITELFEAQKVVNY